MKTCLECQSTFYPEKSHTKYCSKKCCDIFNQRMTTEKFRNNPELRKKKNDYERERRRIKGRSRDKKKHAEEEKKRYWKKNGIHSESDLKCGPKGSGTITRYGYRQITLKNHPNSRRCGTMFEHVLVMSNHLGRPIEKGETIHHKNGIRHDNRIENLELWSKSHPQGQRIEDKIAWCKEFLDFYGFDVVQRN